MVAGRPREHDLKIPQILEMVLAGIPERQIVKMLGVGKGTINRCKRLHGIKSKKVKK